ncbi:ATP synthase subunit I [Methylobacter sp. YRD-M1]|uniref:ATP synthase subunit I n=1 Tax=Methylobacter sp. YRD-M1 TaxID=2911520 RepID=UPI00227D668C|nr:ATP synthase subunit I [Methylobacter sp. YRD-M1]WAK03929.1 ATP synthase subunit I [Methylobacter sp. YRD-M1]
MMENVYLGAVAVLWGIGLGLVYFGGLWLTIRRLPAMKHQALWMLGSFLLRNVLVAAGLYAIIAWGWQYVLLCLAGIIGVRFVMIRRIHKSLENERFG